MLQCEELRLVKTWSRRDCMVWNLLKQCANSIMHLNSLLDIFPECALDYQLATYVAEVTEE